MGMSMQAVAERIRPDRNVSSINQVGEDIQDGKTENLLESRRQALIDEDYYPQA
jgi:hypothetical protein